MVTKSYRDAYQRSLEQPADFWVEAARGVSWSTPPRRPSTPAGHRFMSGFRTGS